MAVTKLASVFLIKSFAYCKAYVRSVRLMLTARQLSSRKSVSFRTQRKSKKDKIRLRNLQVACKAEMKQTKKVSDQTSWLQTRNHGCWVLSPSKTQTTHSISGR